MQGFYEKHRDESDIFIKTNTNLIFPAHFHRNIEVALVKSGKYEITVSGKKYIAAAESIVIVDNYEIHSYDRVIGDAAEADACALVFPSAYIERFNFLRRGKAFLSSVINDPRLYRELMEITEKYLTRGGVVSKEGSELFFALLSLGLDFVDKRVTDDCELVRRILVYVEENFKSELSREKIARELGYTEAHVSRVFHSFIGKGIREYINGVRLSYIDAKISLGDSRLLLDLIEEAGFKSQQTYYRARRREKRLK